MEPVILRTERLELSLPVEADVDAIYAACQDPGIQRYTPVPFPYERTHADGFVRQIPKDWEAGQNLTWGIHEAGALVGTIGVYRVDGMGNGELGYWVAPEARGGGRLVEAAHAVIDWAFSPDGLGLTRMEWRAVVGNVASARAASRLGFRYEGLLRQALANTKHRDDGWIAALLVTDDRMPQPWPVLED
ncbi:GNAT family N-acetyltransferase [Microbacterium sp. CFBP9034]|uniref:GNAT family N-acetyltransferase n=1 Tax=Microbacterium sp. CFBP9034 TaxID=3096540 RepID=UPI002A6B4CED|nr:GNAT family N-acetyltransferase [Microbacterium sp. CFBP9034]MDY0908932.1 GNAT family N-acetyltransferase [Microbacterium sp. CFBP9034]